jgi:cytochrome P450
MVTLTREKKEKVIPSLKELPLLGSVITHYGAGRFDLYRRIARECGDIGLFHLGPYRVIQVVSSELVHSLLVEHANDFDKGEIPHKVFRSVTGNGLFINEGEAHRRQRKLMSPFFQPRHIVSYAETMVRYVEEAQQHWRDGDAIDMDREMMALTMSLVGKVLFNADIFTEAFCPERFAPEQEKQLPRSAYIPFGGGPRICIGNHFALMEGQLLLATLAQRVTFELAPNLSLELDPNKSLTMRTKNTIKMIVRRRSVS